MIGLILAPFALATPWRDCTGGDAPSDYVKASCESYYISWDGNTPTEVPFSVCDTHVGGVGHCEPAYNWNGEPVEIRAATHYNGDGTEFSVWGMAASGETFCCAWEEEVDGELYELDLQGNTEPDTISARGAIGEKVYNPGGSSLALYLDGGTGADDLVGPTAQLGASGLSVEIRGGNGADNITTFVASTCYGDDGADSIVGSTESDDIYGDIATSSGWGDAVSAGAGADTVHGGPGADIVCSGDGDDTMYGDAGNDSLFGGAGTDSATGGAGTDACSAESHDCESGLGSPPLGCP